MKSINIATKNEAEPINFEKLSKPEIITVDELKDLPEGICLMTERPEGSGVEALNAVISEIVLHDEEKRPGTVPGYLMDLVIETKNRPSRLIGEVMKYPHAYRRRVIDEILNRYPNICWLRGTDYSETDSGVPIPTKFRSTGSNGYLGDLSAVGFAEENYSGNSHPQSVLFITSLKKIMEGVDSGAIKLGTEHNYDVTVIAQKDYDEWALNSWVICDLGQDKADFAKAKEILRSKVAVVKSNSNS